MRDALKTLLHPFIAELIPSPASGARILFLGAEPGFASEPGLANAQVACVQGFRPTWLALMKAGQTVLPTPDGHGHDMTLILCSRHKGLTEFWLNEAIARTKPEGMIVVAGAKDDGVISLRKRLEQVTPLLGSAPKHHGLAFWFANPGNSLTAFENATPNLVDGRFRTAPGMFSHDRVDVGSRLLAAKLPDDLRGKVADFCAGWGYLGWEAVSRFPRVTALDLYEADFASIEAARSNLSGFATPPIRCFWHDLASEKIKDRYNVILMNPPFHAGRAAEPHLGQSLIAAAAEALAPRGRLLMVANQQLPYEKTLAAHFKDCREIARDFGFKVIFASR